MSHKCHWPGCRRDVPPRFWGCGEHWFKLPVQIRDAIWKAYRPGQEITKDPSVEYLVVAELAQQWIKDPTKVQAIIRTPLNKRVP